MDADRSKNAAVDVSGRINVVPDRNPEQLVQHRHKIAVRRDRLTVFRIMTGTEIETAGEIADVMIKQKKRGRLAVKPAPFLIHRKFFPIFSWILLLSKAHYKDCRLLHRGRKRFPDLHTGINPGMRWWNCEYHHPRLTLLQHRWEWSR